MKKSMSTYEVMVANLETILNAYEMEIEVRKTMKLSDSKYKTHYVSEDGRACTRIDYAAITRDATNEAIKVTINKLRELELTSSEKEEFCKMIQRRQAEKKARRSY